MAPDTPLVSIIIPTYNRAHLIGETLDSVLAQTYQNWECIVVDDGSTDNTEVLMAGYMSRDSRFQYHHRPKDRLPGGNAARNYGFEVSKGEYIQWFDSDDLMTPNKLKIKLDCFKSKNTDFVISKTRYFNRDEKSYSDYTFLKSEINFENFALQRIKWLTPDLMVSRTALGNVRYLENLKAGQEYNFCCNLLLRTQKGYFIDQFLTLQRYNENSIQGERDANSLHHRNTIFHVHWLNYLNLEKKHNNVLVNKFNLYQCTRSYFSAKGKIQVPQSFYRKLILVFGRSGFYAIIAMMSIRITGRYHRLFKKYQTSLSWEIRH